MALKHTDNKQNRGWRKFKDKNFGADDKGHGFASNWLNSYVSKHTIVPPREMDSSGQMIYITGMSTTITTAAVLLGSLIGGIVWHVNYDEALEAESTAYGSSYILENASDEAGAILTYSREHGHLMLRREGDFYQIYEGEPVHENDMAYRLVTDDQQALEITSDVVTEISASLDYPEIVGFNGKAYEFNAISHYYRVEGKEGLYRAVDEMERIENSEDWSQENLRHVFSEANEYFQTGGNYMVAFVPEEHDAYMLAGPLNDPNDMLKIFLGGFGLYSGLGAGISLLQANNASRKRHRREEKKFKP